MSMMSSKTWAHDIEVKNADGVTIYYVWTDNKNRLAVSCRGYESNDYPNEYSGKVVIPESVTYNGTTYPVTSIKCDALRGCTGLTSITIPESITSIGEGAFRGCTGLTSLRIEDGDQTLYIYSGYDAAIANCNALTTLYIGRNISTSNNSSPFYGAKIKNVTIGDKVTTIGNYLFSGCTGLTAITIPNSVTSIGDYAFQGCTGLTSVTIGNSVTSIGQNAFSGCSNISDVHIDDLTNWCSISFGDSNANPHAKHLYLGDNEIKDLVIPNDVTQISFAAFYGCTGLTSVTIGNSVKSIGQNAFCGCTGLTAITIPNSVTTIGKSAFSYCTGLASVRIEDGDKTLSISGGSSYGAFRNCNSLTTLYVGRNISNSNNSSPFYGSSIKDVTIGDNVTTIVSYLFSGCTGLTAITIPNSVTIIGERAFSSCTGLVSVRIEDGDHTLSIWAGSSYGAFSNCNALTTLYVGRNISNSYNSYSSPFSGANIKNVTIGDKVTTIGNYLFDDCTGLTSIEIPNSVTNIGNYAFQNCRGLASVTIGTGLTDIGEYAFANCSKVNTISMPDNISSIGSNAFATYTSTKFLVNKGTKTLLSIWNYYQKRNHIYKNVYDKEGENELLPPSFIVEDITQTKATVKFENVDLKDGFVYTYNDEPIKQTEINHTALKPDTKQNVTLVVSKEDVSYTVTGSYTTKGLSPRVDDGQYEVTASSIRAMGTYTEEDAKVVAQRMYIRDNYSYNNKEITHAEGAECYAFGLNPGRSYTVVCEIDVDYGGTETATYSGTRKISTQSMRFSTAAPKVVSRGNAVVSATVNLDENEENVGFEWRCVDWTNEFPSNTGTAILYDGVIEGYIKELNTDKLWKFRPYYLSDTGTYHYGDWMGLDPTNTSYFEPTVRTYAKININGNTALVRGYVLSGSDDIVVKGFKYWRTGVNMHTRAESVPEDAITVEATGQQTMSANLKGLEYNSTYHYIAFATTSSGETYYGDEQVFSTPLATAKYATFYDSQSAYRLPVGLAASVVTGVNNGKLVYKVIADGSKNNNVLPKGVAVMLTSEKGEPSDYTMTPVKSGETYTGENWLKGSDNTTTTTGTNCLFYKLSYGPSGTERSGVFGWYWGAANGGAFKIEGHKAWLAVPKSAGVKTRGLEIEGETLGVEELEKSNVEELHTEDAWYMIDGRKLNGVPTSTGIYINQGKKYIIK